jgi:hypothetical protein
VSTRIERALAEARSYPLTQGYEGALDAYIAALERQLVASEAEASRYMAAVKKIAAMRPLDRGLRAGDVANAAIEEAHRSEQARGRAGTADAGSREG